tara:strand:- start:3142 stop:3609 length:468 start_codon:yes stop_codon:yes gene_type:complete
MAVNIIEGVNSYIADTVKIIGAGNITIGNNVQIRDYTVIELGAGNITIGNDVVIGYNSFIQCTGTINIGNDVIAGPHCVFLASSHSIDENISFYDNALIRGTLSVKGRCWFGANCTINPVTIEKNVIIGANSFVNKDVQSNQVVGGSPAKYIKKL